MRSFTKGKLPHKNVPGLKNVQFEDALNMTGFGKYSYFTLFVCFTSLLAMSMELFGMSFLSAAAVCDFHIANTQRGILTAVPLLGSIVMAYPWGYITDTKGRRATLLWSMSGGFVFSLLSSFAPNLIVFCVLKFFSSLFVSAANACVYTMLGEFLPKKNRDNMLMILTNASMFVSAANGAVSFLVLTYLDFKLPIDILGISYTPWRFLVIMLALPMAISAITLIWMDETPKFLISQGRPDEALYVLRKVYASNTGLDEDTYPVESLQFNEETINTEGDSFLISLWRQFAPLFHKRYLKNTIYLFYIQLIMIAIGSGLSMWLPYISNNFYLGLQEEGAYVKDFCSVVTDPDITVINIASEECVGTLSPLSFGFVIFVSLMNGIFNSLSVVVLKFTGKRIFLIGIQVFSSICGIVISLIHNPIAGIVIYLLFNFQGLGTGPLTAFAVEIYPTYLRGMSVCMLLLVGRIGGIIMTNILGAVFESHCDVTFYGLGALLLSSAIIAIFLPKDSRNRNKIIPEKEITKL